MPAASPRRPAAGGSGGEMRHRTRTGRRCGALRPRPDRPNGRSGWRRASGPLEPCGRKAARPPRPDGRGARGRRGRRADNRPPVPKPDWGASWDRVPAVGSLALSLHAVAPALAEERSESLTGEFYVVPADPEAGSSPAVVLTPTGEAARSVYEGLSTPAEDE